MTDTPSEQHLRKHGRGTAWVFIEMLCAFLAVAGVNMKLADGRPKKERLAHANDAFKYHVQEKWDTKQWVDQHGVAEDRKTAQQSIQERVHHINSDTQDTAISAMFDHITKLARNIWLPHLRTLLDSNGHIRSGQVKEDVIEALRLYYFDHKAKRRPSKTGQTELDREQEGVAPNPVDPVKVQAAKDRFHPPELYVFVRQGPAVIGGQNNVFLLQDPAAMQQALGHGGGSRKKMRATNSEAVEGEARQKKVSVVTTTLTSALLMASPTSSSASSVPSSASTFAALAEDRRERERRLENERRFVTTDRLAARLVFPLPYSVLALLAYMHM